MLRNEKRVNRAKIRKARGRAFREFQRTITSARGEKQNGPMVRRMKGATKYARRGEGDRWKGICRCEQFDATEPCAKKEEKGGRAIRQPLCIMPKERNRKTWKGYLRSLRETKRANEKSYFPLQRKSLVREADSE